jgi:molecular chaperone DnaK
LRLDAERATNEEFRAAVITVPASFEVPQRKATTRAAELAGFETVVLQQEPIAAGLARNFQQAAEEKTWLVYDLGGGTFDAAILRAQGGQLSVLEHGGDNHLGGENITRQIVDSILIPALRREYELDGFSPGAPKWHTVYASLLAAAEIAKIRLSRTTKELVTLERVNHPATGEELFFEYELIRGQVDSLAAPLVAQTVRSCKSALAAAGLGRDDIAEIVLVGGPTLMPYLREVLEDKGEGLGIRIAPVPNPMTIVAEGAAVFAGTQLLLPRKSTVIAVGAISLKLSYEPIGASDRPVIEGVVSLFTDRRQEQWTIEFSRDGDIPWESGRIRLSLDGRFRARLFAEPGRRNEFAITLRDGSGRAVATDPARCVYTMGMVSDEQRTHHAIGVAMADNSVDQIIPKGTPWPAHGRIVHELAFDLEVNGGRDLCIPVVEGGDMWRADRNRCIGTITLPSERFPRNLGEGTKVEISLELRSGGEVKANALLAEHGIKVPCKLQMKVGLPAHSELQSLVANEGARFQILDARALGSAAARAILRETGVNDLMAQVTTSLEAAKSDRAALLECENRLMSLRGALDRVEAELELPGLRMEIDGLREEVVGLIGDIELGELSLEWVDLDERVTRIDDDLEKALDACALQQVRHLKHQLEELKTDGYWRTDAAWYGLLNWLRTQRYRMADGPYLDYAMAAAERAADGGDVALLRTYCLRLYNLLPGTGRGADEPQVEGLPGVTRRLSQ